MEVGAGSWELGAGMWELFPHPKRCRFAAASIESCEGPVHSLAHIKHCSIFHETFFTSLRIFLASALFGRDCYMLCLPH